MSIFGRILDWIRNNRPPKPPSAMRAAVTVVTSDRQEVPGLVATLRIETQPTLPPIVGKYYTDAGGTRVGFAVPADRWGHGAYLNLVATGYYDIVDQRVPASEMGEFSMRKKTAPTPHGKYTRAQLMDIQTDLMVYCPELGLDFSSGMDPETGIMAVADNGQTPHGIHQGYFWCLWTPRLPTPERRQVVYNAALRMGWTHFAIQVTQPSVGDKGYHGLTSPVTQAEADNAGTLAQLIHGELLFNNLIPIPMGVSPVDSPGGAPLARGFDPAIAMLAGSDWDNSRAAASRIKAVHDTFPNALVYYERPGPMGPDGPAEPEACPDDPIPPTPDNGGAWLRAMQQAYPRFVGVMYEVNLWEGKDAAAKELDKCHSWWRDVQEVSWENDTYVKFWQGGDLATYNADNDWLLARCPFLKGFGSGGTTHPAPVDDGEVIIVAGNEDMIPADQITFVSCPALGPWPKTADIVKLDIQLDNIHVEFTKRDGPDRWPDIVPPGWDGPMQYSMGLICKVNGVWYSSAPVELWYALDAGGGHIQNDRWVATQWFYDNRWGPLHNYQPAPDEEVGFYVCAGDARNSENPLKERSNFVKFRMPAPGKTITLVWR